MVINRQVSVVIALRSVTVAARAIKNLQEEEEDERMIAVLTLATQSSLPIPEISHISLLNSERLLGGIMQKNCEGRPRTQGEVTVQATAGSTLHVTRTG